MDIPTEPNALYAAYTLCPMYGYEEVISDDISMYSVSRHETIRPVAPVTRSEWQSAYRGARRSA